MPELCFKNTHDFVFTYGQYLGLGLFTCSVGGGGGYFCTFAKNARKFLDSNRAQRQSLQKAKPQLGAKSSNPQ